MPDDRHFFTVYSVSGRKFNVDAILEIAKPISKHSVWRRGEPDPVGGKAVTSGISILVFTKGSQQGLHRAVKRFLTREKRFLGAVRRAAGPGVRSELGTGLFVRDGQAQPIRIELPPEVLGLLGVRGVTWHVGAVPCYEDGTYMLGGSRPPK